jgi:hypothetical protein
MMQFLARRQGRDQFCTAVFGGSLNELSGWFQGRVRLTCYPLQMSNAG